MSLFGLIYGPPPVKGLVLLGVVVADRSHLASNMLHVSCLMVWLLTSAGETNWLHAEKKKHKPARRVNA